MLAKLGRSVVVMLGCFVVTACGSGGGGDGGGGAGNPTTNTPNAPATRTATPQLPTATVPAFTATPTATIAVATSTALVTLPTATETTAPPPTGTMIECPATTTPAPTASPAPPATQTPVIGPDVTRLGVADASGTQVTPFGVEGGLTVYRVQFGSGFILFVEGRPGLTGLDVGALTYNRSPFDPNVRPDLQLQVTRNLGNGSPTACDNSSPNLGGIPGIDPPSYDVTQGISDALNDLSCRFSTFDESQFPCTQDGAGNFAFADPNTTRQFCVLISNAIAFAPGDTTVTARLRDSGGNSGPPTSIIVRVAG